MAKDLWGHTSPPLTFYQKQIEILDSVMDNDETYVPAGNMLGKDFVAGFLVLWYFLVHREVRIITTSVKDGHLDVLWGEIGRFLQTAKFDLTDKHAATKADSKGVLYYNGEPVYLIHTQREIRKVVGGKECEISYLKGMVSAKGEGMAGHHAPSTLLVVDEASGVDDLVYTQGDTWAGGGGSSGNRKRKLIIGNPNPCRNFFYKGVKAGDLIAS